MTLVPAASRSSLRLAPLAAAALAAEPSRSNEVRTRLFESLGWRVEIRGREDSLSFSLTSGGTPAVFVTSASEPARAISLGYSNEAILTLAWTRETLRLLRTEVWSQSPGDTSIASVPVQDDVAAFQLLDALGRDRFAGLLEATQEGDSHRRLADELAGAFSQLRLDVSEAENGHGVDRDVFQLFHQLLFVRFHEDRFGPVDETGTLSEALENGDAIERVEALLASYTSRFNSELFGERVAVAGMPESPVLNVIQVMVEPWDQLRLNFSVTSSDVAGRLYQSFLANTPAIAREGRLFPVAIPIDRQRERGAFYTPQPVAELLARRSIEAVLREKLPESPSEVRVIDPACGSGAFLLAAYRVLAQYFVETLGREDSEALRLEILTESIFGGDTDEIAIALTRIQLLEEARVDKSRLPSLGLNIALDDLLSPVTGDQPHGWDSVLNAGGFDVVLSNPPFHGPRDARRAGFDTASLQSKYQSARGTGWNIASTFVEAGLGRLASQGRLTMLIPQAVLDGPSGAGLRESVGDDRVIEILDFGRNELFAPTMAYVAAVGIRGASTSETVTLTQASVPPEGISEIEEAVKPRSRTDGTTPRGSAAFSIVITPQKLRDADTWSPFIVRWMELSNEEIEAGVKWIGDSGTPEVVIGTQTGADRKFVFGSEHWIDDGDHIILNQRYAVPRHLAPMWVRGASIKPFSVGPLSDRVVVPQIGEDEVVDELIESVGGVPKSFRPGDLRALRGPKVVIRGLFDEPAAAADMAGEFMIPQGGAGAVALVVTDELDVLLLESLLNSALYQWLLQGLGHAKGGGFVQLMRHHWRRVPWPLLSRDQKGLIVSAGNKVKDVLNGLGDRRTSRYWDARLDLDAAVYEQLGVGRDLQECVTQDLWRRP